MRVFFGPSSRQRPRWALHLTNLDPTQCSGSWPGFTKLSHGGIGHLIKRIFGRNRIYSGESATKSSQLSVSLAGK